MTRMCLDLAAAALALAALDAWSVARAQNIPEQSALTVSAQNLQQQLNALKAEIASLQKIDSTLTSEVGRLQISNAALQSEVESLREANSAIQSRSTRYGQISGD